MWIDRLKELAFWCAGVAMMVFVCWLAIQLGWFVFGKMIAGL